MSTNMEVLLEARRELEEQRRRLEAEGREGELRLRELQQRQEQALARLARAGARRDNRVEAFLVGVIVMTITPTKYRCAD